MVSNSPAVPFRWIKLAHYRDFPRDIRPSRLAGHPTWEGYGVTDMSPPWLVLVIVAALLFFPVLGNLRPDLVSFQLVAFGYDREWADVTM